jgi:hypothetical protein
MKKVLALLTSAGCAVVMLCANAQAATLSLVGGTPLALPGPAAPNNGFNPTNTGGVNLLGLGVGSIVTVYDSANTIPNGTFGLFSDTATELKFTYIGKEAGFNNEADASFTLGTNFLFTTDTAAGGATASGSTGAGIVPFLFATNNGSGSPSIVARNGGAIASGLRMAFYLVGGDTAFAMFDDGGAGPDADFDDMFIKIQAVPIPAALPLFAGGLGMLGWLARRRKRSQLAEI